MASASASTDLNNTEGHTSSSSPEGDYGACRDDTPDENQRDNSNPMETSVEESKNYIVWRKPWFVAMAFFFFYYLFWFQLVIIKRYWIREGWEEALPGLGKTEMRKFTIRMHMTFGGIAVLSSPIQMITPFTSAWKKTGVNWYRRIHRYSGRIFTVCAVLSYIFGQWFIFLKEFELVGGYNMGVAFSFAGFAIAYFAYMAWKTAPSRQSDGSLYTVQDHRNWAIRSFSQIIAPILYRYWYTMLIILKLYRTPSMNKVDADKGDELVCDNRDVCGDYLRPFDVIWAWAYWVSAWLVAEIIILYLPKHKKSGTEDELQSPLLSDDNHLSEGAAESSEGVSTEGVNKRRSAGIVNFIGCLLAILTIVVSGPILVSIISQFM